MKVLSVLALSATVLWLTGARQPAHGQEGKSAPASVAVVDKEKVEKEFKLLQSEKARFDKLAEERGRELTARAFLDDEEWKQLDVLMAKPNPSEEDRKNIENILKSGEIRRGKFQDLVCKVKLDEKEIAHRREMERRQRLNKSRVQAKYEVYGKELEAMRRKMLDPLFNKITETVGNVAPQRGYSVVLPKQSVIWNADTADITDDVIKQLNDDADRAARSKTIAG